MASARTVVCSVGQASGIVFRVSITLLECHLLEVIGQRAKLAVRKAWWADWVRVADQLSSIWGYGAS